jgi:excinuclease ABC subunit C
VLQQARDEAHRFAITFQRKRRALRTVTSELLRIPGVGESKRRQLLAAFGSLQGVRDAAPEAIAALPGFGPKIAEKIVAALRTSAPTAPAAVVNAATADAETTPPVGPDPSTEDL